MDCFVAVAPRNDDEDGELSRRMFYNGNSGSRRVLRRALVVAGDVVDRVKLQRTDEA